MSEKVCPICDRPLFLIDVKLSHSSGGVIRTIIKKRYGCICGWKQLK